MIKTRDKNTVAFGDGQRGRRTGITVEATAERDADGFELLGDYYKESDEEEDEISVRESRPIYTVQHDDSEDEPHVTPQTPAHVIQSHVTQTPAPPVVKTTAVGLNDVDKPRSSLDAYNRFSTPRVTRKLKVVSATPVSRVTKTKTAPKITAIKSIQPVPAKQPERHISPIEDTLDSIDTPVHNNPFIAPPTRFEPKNFGTNAVFKTPARTTTSRFDSTPSESPLETPEFKPAAFQFGGNKDVFSGGKDVFSEAKHEFTSGKDVFDIPEDDYVDMSMDMSMDMGGMDMDMDMGLEDSPQAAVSSVAPADVFVSPFAKPKVPTKPKKVEKPKKSSFASKYKPRDLETATSSIFKSFKPQKSSSQSASMDFTDIANDSMSLIIDDEASIDESIGSVYINQPRINYREVSTVDDSHIMDFSDSDDEYQEDVTYDQEEDGDDDDDGNESIVSEALPSPPKTSIRRSKRTVIPPVRYWAGETVNYGLKKNEYGVFVPSIQEVITIDDEEPPAKKKPFEINEQVEEADAEVVENKKSNLVRNWERKKYAEVEVINYSAEEGDPEMHKEVVAYTHDGCEYTEPSEAGLSVAQLFGDKKEFTQSGMVRLVGGGSKPERNSRHHLHTFYVLSGTVDVTIGEHVVRVKAGSPFLIPRGNQFALKNASEVNDALMFYVRSHDTLLRYEESVAQAEMDKERGEE